MTRTIFITGTGTDVGKTVVTRGVVRALVNRGVNLRAVKPIESGVPIVNGRAQPHDATALIRAAKQQHSIEQTCRYMFGAAVSPHLAARMENQVIDLDEVRIFLEQASQDCDLLLSEGAGGLMVPITETTLFADFVASFKAELLIISPNILGTINTTLLTIEAARKRDIPILGVILNHGENNSVKNDEAIALFGQVPIIGTFPCLDDIDDDDALAAAAAQYLDLDKLNP